MMKDHDKFLAKTYRSYASDVIIPNMRQRVELYTKMKINPQLAMTAYALALKDPVYFFKMFLWTHEPRPLYLKWYGLRFARIPFIPYPVQEKVILELVDSIRSGKDILIDKSREQGATWLILGVVLWFWLQRESGNDFLLGSRKFDNVDKKGSVDTLFEKFRYMLYILPEIFIPEGFDANKHDNVGSIRNPFTSSFISGEANNENFSTSGRYRAIVADEFSKWEETDEKAFTSMGSASLCRVIISTPFGMGRCFSKLRFGDSIRILQLHWSDHPLHGAGAYEVEQHPYLPDKKNVKVSPWYLKECERRKNNPEADIGQELDMDHLTSGTPYFRSQMYLIQERYKKLEGKEVGKHYEFVRTADDQIDIFEQSTGRICIVEEPVDGWENRYQISVDVAEGLEHGDNSVFYVFDRVTGEDVAWFVGKIDTFVFSVLLSFIGNKYYQAYIAVERNNQGAAVIQGLKFIYPNLYHKEEFGRIVDVETQQLGFHTNMKTKPIICGKLQQAIADGCEGVSDKHFYQECQKFMYDKHGRLQAEAGSHDDRVIAQAIKWQLHEWLPAPVETKTIIDPFAGKTPFGIKVKQTGDIRSIWN